MRVAARRHADVSPQVLWEQLADPRDWAPLLKQPESDPEVQRVKVLAKGGEAQVGADVQVLYADHSWTVYRIAEFAAGRRLTLDAVFAGAGTGPGHKVPGSHRERLLLIPQGSGAEAEWTLDIAGGLRARLQRGPVDRHAWMGALEARLDALCPRAEVAAPPEA